MRLKGGRCGVCGTKNTESRSRKISSCLGLLSALNTRCTIFYHLHEDANCCAETYEYAYTYNHQCESLHLLNLLYCDVVPTLSAVVYTKTPIAALSPTNTPTPTTINAKACILSDLLYHNVKLFYLCLEVMFLMAILSQRKDRLSIPFLKLSEK